MWNLSFLAKGIPRPHQWLLMGVQACRLPGLKRLKGFKPLQLVFLSDRHPKATSMASYGRPSLPLPGLKRLKPEKPLKPGKPLKPLKPLKLCKSVSERPTAPFARRSQPTGTPRPHQWLLMGVQACRLPPPKNPKTLKT